VLFLALESAFFFLGVILNLGIFYFSLDLGVFVCNFLLPIVKWEVIFPHVF
jgi:hypothetical protein